jgi:uncharacterized protein YbbK (DUF523 family)
LGFKCRFDGGDAYDKEATRLERLIIPVCPEQLGGLPTPRAKAEIAKGSGRDVLNGEANVIDSLGTDITEKFIQGAKEVLLSARLVGAKEAMLKENSPSCGVSTIKRGGLKIDGPGVTTALLIKEGIKVKGR